MYTPDSRPEGGGDGSLTHTCMETPNIDRKSFRAKCGRPTTNESTGQRMGIEGGTNLATSTWDCRPVPLFDTTPVTGPALVVEATKDPSRRSDGGAIACTHAAAALAPFIF